MKLAGWIACLSGVAGLTVAGAMCLIALDHNPQGEFYTPETGGLQWDSLAALFISWAASVAIASFGAAMVAALAFRGLRAAFRNHQLSRSHPTLAPPGPPSP